MDFLGRSRLGPKIEVMPESPVAEAPIVLLEPIPIPRQQIYLGGFRALTNLFTGHKIFVDTRDVGIAAHLLWEGRWEPWIDHHVLHAVQPGMHVCDIGASFGYYTLLMSEKVGPSGHVYSFEPNPKINRLLTQSVSVNGFDSRVTIHKIALGQEDAAMTLHVNEDSVGGGFIHENTNIEGLKSFPVQIRRLDNVIDKRHPIGFLKVDVEGFEDAVMLGAGDILTQPKLRAVLIEFRRTADLPDALPSYISKLFERGMGVEALEPDGPRPLNCIADVMALPLDHLTNLLFKAC